MQVKPGEKIEFTVINKGSVDHELESGHHAAGMTGKIVVSP